MNLDCAICGKTSFTDIGGVPVCEDCFYSMQESDYSDIKENVMNHKIPKQLIPQSRIDEARHKANNRILPKSAYEFDCGWDAGFQFALNEIQPLICEFAEFAYKNYDYIERISNKREWMWKKNNDCFTTQQLLEEFIDFKNKLK